MKTAVQVLLIVGSILAVVLIAYTNMSSQNSAPVDMLEKDTMAKQMQNFQKDFGLVPDESKDTSFDLSQYGAFATHMSDEQVKNCVQKIGLQQVSGELEPEERALVDMLPSLAQSYQSGDSGVTAYRGKHIKKDKVPFQYILFFYKPKSGDACFFVTCEDLILGADQVSFSQAATQEPLPEDLYQKAKSGDKEAQYKIGEIFAQEDGIARARLAKTWYLKAANQGHVDAQYRLGKLYSSGDLGKPDNKEAQKWLNLAIKNGSSEARLVLGQLVATKAIKGNIDNYLLERARKDDTHAQYVLAMDYLKHGVKEKEAIYWLKQSAVHGDFAPLLALAKYYEKKPGAANKAESLKWYNAAADVDSYEALMYLGDKNQREHKYKEAAAYYRRSIMRDRLPLGMNKTGVTPESDCGKADMLLRQNKAAEAASMMRSIAVRRNDEQQAILEKLHAR